MRLRDRLHRRCAAWDRAELSSLLRALSNIIAASRRFCAASRLRSQVPFLITWPAIARRGSFLSQKIDEKNRLKESISQHVTGLPPSLLKLFEARPPPRHLDPIKKKKPALPYTGVAQYVQHFAEPGDEEYEPPPAETRPPEPRIFRNPELATQARVEVHSKPEK